MNLKTVKTSDLRKEIGRREKLQAKLQAKMPCAPREPSKPSKTLITSDSLGEFGTYLALEELELPEGISLQDVVVEIETYVYNHHDEDGRILVRYYKESPNSNFEAEMVAYKKAMVKYKKALAAHKKALAAWKQKRC